MQRTAQGEIKQEFLCTFSYSNTNSKTNISVLYTDKGNPIIGAKKTMYFNPDFLGEKFADGEYTIQPNDLTNIEYEVISNLLGVTITRAGNLQTLLDDECTEISPENAKKGDLFIRYDNVNGEMLPSFYGEIQDVQKGIFGFKYTIDRNGNTTSYKDKDIKNGFKIYRKNA